MESTGPDGRIRTRAGGVRGAQSQGRHRVLLPLPPRHELPQLPGRSGRLRRLLPQGPGLVRALLPAPAPGLEEAPPSQHALPLLRRPQTGKGHSRLQVLA